MTRVTINDLELFSEQLGTGEPLVLIHGGWSDHGNWQGVVPGLAQAFTVVTYDRRGHGSSERRPGTRRDQEDDLAGLIEALGRGPVHVAGTSFGASIAIGLATRRPELFRSLTAHEPALMSLVAEDLELTGVMAPMQAKLQAVVARIERGEAEGAARQFVEEIALGPGAWDQLPQAIRTTFVRNAPALVDEQRDAAWASIDPSALARLAMPVLLTDGGQSPPWFPAIVNALAGLVGHAERWTYVGAGHSPHLTHPGDHVAAVTRFAAGDRIPSAADHA